MNEWNSMAERVDAYLIARRAMGYQLKIEGEQLKRFACYSDERCHHGPITTDLALAWANASKQASSSYRARRLEVVRCLARYCALFEPDTEVPSQNLLGSAHPRKTPYIFSDKEIEDLMTAAGKLEPQGGMRPVTLQCLFGLLAATGLRISEALKLARDDVNLPCGLLLVRETKFTKSRYVPIHTTTVNALRVYTNIRQQLIPEPHDQAFFLMKSGLAPNYRQVLYAFQCIRKRLGWRASNGRQPRIHDLRHTFATCRLLSWYREGEDVNNALPRLSTYLGHTKVTDTYWYLTAIPELMAIAAKHSQCSLDQKEFFHD